MAYKDGILRTLMRERTKISRVATQLDPQMFIGWMDKGWTGTEENVKEEDEKEGEWALLLELTNILWFPKLKSYKNLEMVATREHTKVPLSH